MSWNTLATTDITAEILPDEVTMLNTIQGSSSILATILATVPDQIRSDAIALVRWKWFCSLPKTDLQSEFRRAQYDEAVKRLEKIREGREKVEIPTQPQNVTGPSFRLQTIRRGHRVGSRSFDKLGET